MVSLLDENDMVVAARTGAKVAIPIVRRPAKWMLNQLANYLSESKIPDLNSGLRAFRRESLLPFLGILPSGFSFTTTITLAMHVNDRSVCLRSDRLPPAPWQVEDPARPGHRELRGLDRADDPLLPAAQDLPAARRVSSSYWRWAIFFYSWKFTPKIMDASVTITLMTAFQMAMIGLLADLIDKRSQR